MSEMKMVSKLSMKNAGVSAKKIHTDDKLSQVSLAKIFGIADGVKTVEDATQGKLFFPLTGRFQAVNSETGDITRSGVLYLPTGIHETYEAAVRKLEEGDSLTFAIEVRAVRASNPAGYSYEAIDLMPPVETDALSELALKAETIKRASLPAPAPAQTMAQASSNHPTQASKVAANVERGKVGAAAGRK